MLKEVSVSTTSDEMVGATAPSPRDIERYINDLAPLHDRYIKSMDVSESWISRWLDVRLGTGRRALDVGCGTGRYTIKLADRYDDVVGVDVASMMIEIAERDRSRPNIRYQIRNVLSLTQEHDGRFDLVLAIGSVSHVGPPELVLDRLRRLVAKGGALLIVEPIWQPGWGSRDWQVDFAFRSARAAWEATGDMDDVTATLRIVLNPVWLELTKIVVPLTREDFLREYSAALPGVIIGGGCDRNGIELLAVSWRAADE